MGEREITYIWRIYEEFILILAFCKQFRSFVQGGSFVRVKELAKARFLHVFWRIEKAYSKKRSLKQVQAYFMNFTWPNLYTFFYKSTQVCIRCQQLVAHPVLVSVWQCLSHICKIANHLGKLFEITMLRFKSHTPRPHQGAQPVQGRQESYNKISYFWVICHLTHSIALYLKIVLGMWTI